MPLGPKTPRARAGDKCPYCHGSVPEGTPLFMADGGAGYEKAGRNKWKCPVCKRTFKT